MSTDIRPGWLLRQSWELAVEPGRGRPRTADLRRAVSAAYYAVFHRLSRTVSQAVAPDATDQQTQYELCRVWQHGDFYQVCCWINNAKKPSSSWVRGVVTAAQRSPELVRVAENFQLLMEARHKADYDHLTAFRRMDAIGVTDAAERTLCDLERIRCDDPSWRAFVTLALLRTKVA